MMDAQQTESVKVSVVLPVYNQGHYLVGALQSLVSQTYADFELIIVNDGSTDTTPEVLAKLNHPRIKIISQQNQGLPAALNAGFAIARGEYWTWTSADNIMTPIWLESLVKALAGSHADIGYACSFYAGMDDNGKILFVNRDLHFDLPTLLLRHTGNASFLYRASLARRVGAYDVTLSHAEDLDMWIRMAAQTRAVLVESILYYYRLHNNSMTTQSEKVAHATQRAVKKFLAKTNGIFDIDTLVPAISLSPNPPLERWKSRVWLTALGATATYYCPVDALVEQLTVALRERYEARLIANIVHLYAREDRWVEADKVVKHYQQSDHSPLLQQLARIVAQCDKVELSKIPFAGIDEKLLAADCRGSLTPRQLTRNLAPDPTITVKQTQPFSLETWVTQWVNQLEDQQNHPEVWRSIGRLEASAGRQALTDLHVYLQQLLAVPQAPTALMLLLILECVCAAYLGKATAAKERLTQLSVQHSGVAVIHGALLHISQDERCCL